MVDAAAWSVAVKCSQLEEARGLVGRMVESHTRRIEEERAELGRRRATSKLNQLRRFGRGLRRHELTEVVLDGVLRMEAKMRCCAGGCRMIVCLPSPTFDDHVGQRSRVRFKKRSFAYSKES